MLYDDSICTPRSVALSMHLRGPTRTLREPTGTYTGQARISPSTARTEIPARSARFPIERSEGIGIYIRHKPMDETGIDDDAHRVRTGSAELENALPTRRCL